ncbi:MAG: hypothetical protein Q4D07_08400 [Selenomonadaceae bacterium]|nr:hypothetical protein [Selenomonadaceae bacterium]
MMKKKALRKACALFVSAALWAGSALTTFAAAPVSMQDKLTAIETAAYGNGQTGALLDRVNRLEGDFEAQHPNDAVAARVERLYGMIFTNEKGPSLLTQMNAVEYRFNDEVSMEPIQKRITALEMNITGKTEAGAFNRRIDKLAGYAYGADPLPLTQYVVPAATLIRIALVTPINAKNIKVDDIVEFKASEDVFVDGMLIIAKGAPGMGKVTKVKTAKNFGRDAVVEVDFETIRAMDSTDLKTHIGAEAEEKMEGYAMAAGAGIAGMAVLGPIGVVGAAFVKGRNVNLPEGTELYIQTKEDTILYGLNAPEGAARAAELEAKRKAEAEAKAKKKKADEEETKSENEANN